MPRAAPAGSRAAGFVRLVQTASPGPPPPSLRGPRPAGGSAAAGANTPRRSGGLTRCACSPLFRTASPALTRRCGGAQAAGAPGGSRTVSLAQVGSRLQSAILHSSIIDRSSISDSNQQSQRPCPDQVDYPTASPGAPHAVACVPRIRSPLDLARATLSNVEERGSKAPRPPPPRLRRGSPKRGPREGGGGNIKRGTRSASAVGRRPSSRRLAVRIANPLNLRIRESSP